MARCPQVTPGPIAVQGVRFSYPGQARPALHGVSFRLEPGLTLGLGRADRRRQIDAAEAVAATPRAGRRHAAMERRRPAGLHAWTPCAAPSPGCRRSRSCFPRRVAENIALARPHATPRAGRAGCQAGRGARGHPAPAAGLRHAGRRAWRHAVRRPAAARRDRPRAAGRRARCCCWTTRCRRWIRTPKARILAHLRQASASAAR